MKALIDGLLVGVALLASTAYLYKALAPRGLKTRVAARLSALALHMPSAYGLRRLVTGLAAASATKTGGCGGCDGCAPAAGANQGTAVLDTANQAVAEVRVPLAAIGRRGPSGGA